jgi:membrane-bound serine protease (ClpP class)
MLMIIFVYVMNFHSVLGTSNSVMVINVNTGIGPATTFYIQNSLDEALDNGDKALIIKLNTPGGLLDATREIASIIIDSEIPVIVYVSPSGARAGSAGVFITLSAHLAVMAPATNIGAAHPVGLGGSSDSSVMGRKVENDAAAFARSIAQKRNRNVEWAEKAVRESISSSETEALEFGIIDFVAKDLHQLLNNVNHDILLANGKTVHLNLNSCKIIYREMNFKEKFLTFISNPNFIYILIIIGIYGIFFELKSPGSIFPGAIGTVSLLFAAYSLQMMPINYFGLGLIILALVLFILEVFIISYGFLTISGIASLIFGSMILIDSPHEFMRISMGLIVIVSIVTGLLAGLIIYLGLKAQKAKNSTGKYSIIGQIGNAKTPISQNKQGKILIQGEIWQAISDELILSGDKVKVIQVDSMIVKVTKEL